MAKETREDEVLETTYMVPIEGEVYSVQASSATEAGEKANELHSKKKSL